MSQHVNSDRPIISRRTLVGGLGALAATAAITPAAGSRVARRQTVPETELVIGWPQVTYRTEVDRATIGVFPLNPNIFESLVRLTPDYQVEPLLAESWEFRAPNTFRFTLRQGVTFHDGTPFDSAAVVWSMSRIARAGGGTIGIDDTSTVAIDPYTVDITPITPNLRLVEQLVHPSSGAMFAPNTDPATTRVGTGPYMEVEYLPEDRYVVTANPSYWGTAPIVSRLTFRILPDPTTRVLALQAEEVDLIAELPRESTQEILLDDRFQVVTSGVGAYSAIYANVHGEAPFDLLQEAPLREAISFGIDTQAIVEGVWQGNAEPGISMIPPAILGESRSVVVGPVYDAARAASVLDAAGWVMGDDGVRSRDGRPLTLQMVVGYPNATVHGAMPEFVQAQLAEIGIGIEIVLAADSGIYEEQLAVGTGDLWVEAGAQNDANPCFLPALLFSSPVEGGDAEANAYANRFAAGAEFDQFMTQCAAAESPAEVQAAAASGMQVVIDTERIVTPIAGTFRIFGAIASVSGFVAHPSGIHQRWGEISLAP